MNLNVPLPALYAREVWDYNKAGRNKIWRSIKTCHWARWFINLTMNEGMEVPTNTLINRFRNYISNKKVNLNMVKHI